MNITQTWPCVPVLLTALGGLAIAVRSMALLLGFMITVRRMTPSDRLHAFRDFAHAAGSAWNTPPNLPGQPRLDIEGDDKGSDPNASIGRHNSAPPGSTIEDP